MFHRVPLVSAMAAGVTVFAFLFTALFPSPAFIGVTYAQTNSAPQFVGETTTRSVPETAWYRTTDYLPFMENNNRDAGDPITATDADSGDTLAYSLSGADAGYFKIDSSTGQIRTEDPLDYESDQTSYTIIVSVHDGKDQNGSVDTTIDDTITVTITLTDVNEPPKPSRKEGEPPPDYDGDMEFEIPENTTGPMIFFLKDPEGRGEGWLIESLASDIDPNLFDYVEDAGANGEQHLFFKEPPDFENPEDDNKDNVYHFILRVYDTNPDPRGSTPAQTFPHVTVRVTDVVESNEDPDFADTTTTRSIAENTAAGENIGDPVAAEDADKDTLTYTLGGADTESFDIDAETGQLQAKDALDHETKPSYTVTVSVSDGKDLENSADDKIDDTITVTIDVTDVDDAGTITFSSDSPSAGVALTATLVDDDVPISSEIWLWEIFDDGQANSTTITDADTNSYTPQSTDIGKYLRATVTYTDSFGANKSAEDETSAVEHRPATNNQPTFASQTDTRSVPENTPTGTEFGDAITASDADNDTLTYTLGGADASSFDYDASTNKLKTKAALDFEDTQTTYTVTLSVHDGKDPWDHADTTVDDTITVTINVADMVVPAVPGQPTVNPTPGAAAGLSVNWTAITATDSSPVDGYDVQYRVKDTTDTDPWLTTNVSVSGATATITSLEYSTTYEVQVRAKNSEGESDWSPTGEGEIPSSLSVSFSQASQTVTEGNTATITVNVSPAADRALSIPVSVRGTNTETGDYQVSGLSSGETLHSLRR